MKDFYKLFIHAFEYFTENRYLDSLAVLNDAEKFIGTDSIKEITTSLENLKGCNYLWLNNIDRARECFEKALKLETTSSQACAGLGELFFLEQRDREAKAMYEWAVKNDPENIFALNGLAKVNEVLGFTEDHNTLNELVIINVNEIIKEINFVSDLYQKGKHEEVVEGIESIEKSIGSDLEKNHELLTEIQNMKGSSYLKLNRFDEAQEAFEKALQLCPTNSHACWGLAELFLQRNQLLEAKTMYEWAVKNNPDNKAAVTGLTNVNDRLNLPDEDNMLIKDESLTLQNINDDRLEQAYDLFLNKKYKESLSLLSELENITIENIGNNSDILHEVLSSINNFKGFNFLGLNDLNKARDHFEKALNLNPGSSQACAGLGEIFFIEEKDDEAKTMFEWAVRNDPENMFGAAGLEKINTVLNLPPDHNTLAGGSFLTLSSGKTLSL